MGTIGITVSLVSIMLFTIAIIGFAINFAADNNSQVSIANDADFASLNSNAQNNASYFTSNSSSEYQSIVQSTIPTGAQTIQSAAPFTVTPSATLGTFENILAITYKRIFGSNSNFNIFFVSLAAVIILIIGLYLYKTLRGFPD